jgi:large subunit ribosomal protein L22
MSIKASAKSVSISPRKVGVVAALVRNRSVEDALTILEHVPRRSALPVTKLLKSAKANAENNHSYKPESLVISSILVTPGSRLKRYKPAARGQALPFQKKTSHIFVELEGQKRQPAKTKKETK